MRTTVASATVPRRWLAALTATPYRSLTPPVWQHTFVSDRPMLNWSGSTSLLLAWAADQGLEIEHRLSRGPT